MEQQSQTETQIIIEKIKTGEIKFPLIRERIDDPRKLFEKLQKYIPTVSYKNFRYRNIQWKDPHYEKIKYKEKHYVSFLTQPKDYEEIDRLVDYFNEIPRITAKRIDKNYSLLEAWSNEDTLKKWITNQTIKNPQFVFSSYEWREELWKRSLECNAFKSTLAKSVYYSFKAKRILDFSAGWGDRLLAAIAHKAERYLGFDPNISLKQGHTEIIETFSTQTPKDLLTPPPYEIRVEPFETAIIDKTEYFDLVFTSPPYFNFEIYTNDETQSIQRYPTHQEWIVKFLFRSLYKSWSHLQENGNMIIHLSDIYRSHYVESMTLFVLGWCPNSRFDGSIASIGDSFKPRPMWIYHKETTAIATATAITSITSTAARKCMQQNYPEIYQKLSDFLPFIISE